MTRHIDLGNNSDEALCSVSYNLANLILCVEVGTIRLTLQLKTVYAVCTCNLRILANATDLGELGILLDLDTPALILGDVPVETVHLVHCGCIDYGLNLVNSEEVTANIE